MNADPRVVRAVHLAVEAHGGQLRKDGRTPYVVHPLAVLRRLSAQLRVTDPELLSAAALHDVLEDTEVPAERIEQELGGRVLAWVRELTLPPDVHGPGVPTAVKTQHLVAGLRSMSWEAVLVKLCDRWDNLEDTEAAPWTRRKMEEFFDQSASMLEALRDRRATSPEPASMTEAMDRGVEGVRTALTRGRATLAHRAQRPP